MIVFDLECQAGGHRFEGWFGSSADFASQQAAGLVVCPQCGSADVLKAPMAPHVGRKGNQMPALAPTEPSGPAASSAPAAAATPPAAPAARPDPRALALLQAIATAQAEAIKQSRWVGGQFAEEARAMHYGEKPAEMVHGQATREEAEALLEEGVEIAPLLVPVAPPGQVN
ncbi:MAG TPA: DUF1178 family protein [Novosphingobium sp.]|nr:DUF1178 family protein [Novosphingobium sp.]